MLYLPLPADQLNATTGPNTILIVEDLEDTLAWLRAIVEETFPTAVITTAGTLRDANKCLNENVYDLVLVDLGLPDGTGIDLIKRMRSQSEKTYIVVATIYDDEEHLVNALRSGANGYLLKDEHRDRLIQHLQGILTNRAPVSDRALHRVIHQLNQPDNQEITLTSREEEVLQLVAKGYNVTESAEMLGLSANTVKSYLKAVYGKLEISSRAEATAEAIKRQLIEV